MKKNLAFIINLSFRDDKILFCVHFSLGSSVLSMRIKKKVHAGKHFYARKTYECGDDDDDGDIYDSV